MGNWYCNNCNSHENSWAEHQSYKSNESYRRDIRCYSCDRRELIYTDSQKARYKELVKERTSISGYVEEVERFSTWWSNNIATAIVYYNGYYRVFLLVYDPVYSTSRPAVFPENYDCSYWGEKSRGKFSSLSSAKSEANWLRDDLVGSDIGSYGKYYYNPILLIHPYCDSYRSYYNYISSPHVVREEVGNSNSTYFGVVVGNVNLPSNLDNHFRPLDVIKVKEAERGFGVRYWHFGVYLGNGEICEFTREINGVRKVSWSGFLRNQIGELYKHHPIIPFKHCDKISRQIAYSVNKFWENRYNLHNRNCEHFANMIGFGINYSEQIEDEKNSIMFKEGARAAAKSTVIATSSVVAAPFTFGLSLAALPVAVAPIAEGPPTLNNGKGSTVKLTNEINETEDKLGYTTNSRADEIEKRYLQEVPPKEYCRIM